MDKGAAKAERGTPAPRGVFTQSTSDSLHILLQSKTN